MRVGEDTMGPVRLLSICAATGRFFVLANRTDQPDEAYWVERGLWRSDDHGESWTNLDFGREACVAVRPDDPDRVYYMTFAQDVTTEEVNVYRSDDGGKTWEALADNTPLSPGGFDNRIVLDPSNPSRFLLSHSSGAWECIEQ